MLVVLINDRSKCFIVCSVLILTVFMCEMRLRTACRWGGAEVSIYEKFAPHQQHGGKLLAHYVLAQYAFAYSFMGYLF